VPRRPRENSEGTIHHVYARGVAGTDLFRDDFDRTRYLRFLTEVSSRFDWSCLAYCLMTTHVHLLVETPKANLAEGIQSLHGTYAQKFNWRHERAGHLFQSRYGDTRITSDAHLHVATMYIVRNPVEAGLCANPSDWPWLDYEAALARQVGPSKPSTLLEGV
jgi:REP element-mobilizing transposase RayT